MSEIKTTDFDGVKMSEFKGKYSIEALKAKDEAPLPPPDPSDPTTEKKDPNV